MYWIYVCIIKAFMYVFIPNCLILLVYAFIYALMHLFAYLFKHKYVYLFMH